jgi:MFS transporter, DHA2 family, multidrug resistance protein
MAIGLGAMIAVLEEGERRDWFTAEWIRYATVAAALCIPAAIILELTRRDPFIDLRLLRDRGLASASFMGLALGFGLYGTVYILPVYLGQIQGYDAMQIGEVVMWLGVPQLLVLPLVPFFMRHVGQRWLVGFGLALFAASNLMNADMTHDTALPQLIVPQLVRALGQPFIIVPLSALAAGTIAPAKQPEASAIFNIMRNLGGSIGIALLTTFITIREHYHFSRIADRITQNASITEERIRHAAGALGDPAANASRLQAIELIRDTVRREAFVMAYADSFIAIGAALAISILALLLMPKQRRARPEH